MITIVVGDVTEELAQYAKNLYQYATLINSINLDIRDGVYYTSIGDLDSIQSFVSILNKADSLIYYPPTTWSDLRAGKSRMQYWTEFYMLYFRDKKKIIGLDKIVNKIIPLDVVDDRKTKDRQLWIAGCSFSHGVGVSYNERYGQLLADQLKLEVSFLTMPSSSIQWAADQILRSDIQQNDILVWGLTSFNRFYYFNDKVNHINAWYYSKNKKFNDIININLLNSEHLKYMALVSIYQVINFCEKIKCKLVLAGLLVDSDDIFYTKEIPFYTQLFGYFGQNNEDLYLDLGTDLQHPGPLTHQWYAEQIANKL